MIPQEKVVGFGSNEEFLEMALSAAHVGSFRWNLKTDELVWSPHHYLIFGVEPGGPALTYATFLDRIHPDDVIALERAVSVSKSTRTGYEHSYRIILPDGRTRIVQGTGKFYYDTGGTPVYMAGIVIDVTDAALAQEALRLSENRFRTLADGLPLLAWTANADGYIHWYNQGWYDYTGCGPQAMEGWGWQSVHDPSMLDTVMARWQASIATGEPFEMVFPLKAADGTYRRFLTRARPVRDDRGNVKQWVGTNTLLDGADAADAAAAAVARP